MSTADIRELLERKSLQCLRETIQDASPVAYYNGGFYEGVKSVEVLLPLRVNWCGTWTDTPPYCLENGGAVVNAALSVNSRQPVRVCAERITQRKVVLEYFDSEDHGEFFDEACLTDLSNPLEPFALLKSALMVSGIVPLPEAPRENSLFDRLAGGLYLSTGVAGIPKGSGLGTSSILLAACIKALFRFTGRRISNTEICRRVLLAEQLMGTGGGWQDQAGGLIKGIKLVTSSPGNRQDIKIIPLKAPADFTDELNRRFCLVYSGKRRLGRTILREMMGGYLRSEPKFVKTLAQIHTLAGDMSRSIVAGDMDAFAEQMNTQARASAALGTGYMNAEMDSILSAAAALTASAMMCGAGGGGFIQVLLKKGLEKEDLHKQLQAAFPNRGIGVWDTALL